MVIKNRSFEGNPNNVSQNEVCIHNIICGAEIDLNDKEYPSNVLPVHQVGGNYLSQGLCRRVLGG